MARLSGNHENNFSIGRKRVQSINWITCDLIPCRPVALALLFEHLAHAVAPVSGVDAKAPPAQPIFQGIDPTGLQQLQNSSQAFASLALSVPFLLIQD